MKISISGSAFGDIKSIKEYYAEQGVAEIGNTFIISIFEQIQTLSDHPKIGRVVPEFGNNAIREIIHPLFRIVYLLETASIQIIRVWRCERSLRLPEDGA